MKIRVPHVNLPLTESPWSIDRDVIGVGDRLSIEAVLEQALEFDLRQIVQKQAPRMDREINLSNLMLTDEDKFLEFPLSSILAPTEAGAAKEAELLKFDFVFERPVQKYQMLDELSTVLDPIFKSKHAKHDAFLVADELFTNAIYNAPGLGRDHVLADVRTVRPGRIFVGHDDYHVIIGCEDAYGSLEPIKLLRRIRDCFVNGVADALNFGYGGAGIGSFMIFEAIASLYIGVEKNRRTIICGSLPIKENFRKRAETPKNLHFFRKI